MTDAQYLILDLRRPYRELGKQPKGQADYVEQNGIIFAWSESNCQYEQAWWLYINREASGEDVCRLADRCLEKFGTPDLGMGK